MEYRSVDLVINLIVISFLVLVYSRYKNTLILYYLPLPCINTLCLITSCSDLRICDFSFVLVEVVIEYSSFVHSFMMFEDLHLVIQEVKQ